MAKLVITSTANRVKVQFNEYASALETDVQTWSKRVIQNFRKVYPSGCILVNIAQEKEWCVTWDGADGSFKVDSVDGVPPTSNSDLFDKLDALIQ